MWGYRTKERVTFPNLDLSVASETTPLVVKCGGFLGRGDRVGPRLLMTEEDASGQFCVRVFECCVAHVLVHHILFSIVQLGIVSVRR
jgi:hypothetical protein